MLWVCGLWRRERGGDAVAGGGGGCFCDCRDRGGRGEGHGCGVFGVQLAGMGIELCVCVLSIPEDLRSASFWWLVGSPTKYAPCIGPLTLTPYWPPPLAACPPRSLIQEIKTPQSINPTENGQKELQWPFKAQAVGLNSR